MRGRRPKPTLLKLVTGNPGKRAINLREPKPVPKMPEPPAALSAEARQEWDTVAPQLFELGLLTSLDRMALAAYCEASACWALAQRALAEMAERDPVTRGLLIKTTNGNAIQNPLIGIRNKAQSDMARYAAEFGMTPSARSRVKDEALAPVKEIDPAAEWLS